MMIWKHIATFMLLAALAGCQKEEKTVAVSVTGYNHIENEAILGFSVNGASGPNVSPYAGGSKYSCCLSIPQHWKPGMTATVNWQYGSGPIGSPPPPPPQSATVEIPEYGPERIGDIQVHFYPDHRIKVVVSPYELGHPDHPLPKDDWYPWTLDEAVVRNLEWQRQQKKNQAQDSQESEK